MTQQLEYARGPLETPAKLVVTGVRKGVDHRLGISVVALLVVLVLGVTYLVFGVFQADPTTSKITVRVNLSLSGGLLPNQDVTVRGVPVGKVDAVELSDDGVVAVAKIDGGVKIPSGGEVRVAGLSPAGEQYLDFRPATDAGPYLTDGSVVESDQTTTPVAMADLLGDLDGMLAQISPEKVETIITELGVGPEGPEKLESIITGGTFLISTLDSVLPQTVSLINNSRVVLGTLREMSPGLQRTSENLAGTMDGIASMDAGFRTFVDQTPATLQAVDSIIADNSPTMVQLLGNLTTVAQLTYLRVPALTEFFFPQDRTGSALDAISSVMRDGGIWAAVNIYPRSSCQYDTPRRPHWQVDFPEPYLYATYCTEDDPAQLIRGAANAPRPEGVSAGPPPGVDPLATASPTPIGPESIPLPYAGPVLPSAP
ncbi:MCE family protein [Williamsia sp.]|uniref:MlaD family protein n=1 Tax=Williamsia sp. TaxID=1872085 RepID=UPI002F940FB2